MDRKLRYDGGSKPDKTDILNNQGIDSAAVEKPQIGGGIIELTRKDKGVQGDVGLDPVPVTERSDFGQLILGEVISPEAGVEAGQPEEDRIGTVSNGGLQAIPSPGGSKEFGRGGHGRKE
jgi:hypothetical protein